MKIISDVFLLFGGVTVFLSGLKKLSEGALSFCGAKLKSLISFSTQNNIFAVLMGCITTAAVQSSVATNMIAISFVEGGILNFISACAVVMGTNIGTTMTAQLVAFSALEESGITAIFCFLGFIGFILSSERGKKGAVGKLFLGLGFIFTGLFFLTKCVENFKNYMWFNNLFLVENPLLLLLNGFFVTAFLQSSSVVTSVIIVLASLGFLSFESSVFIILGANVGTCIPVILASSKMGVTAKKVAIFNLFFNLFGSIIFFIPFAIMFKASFLHTFLIKVFRSGITRNIANFHTFFNLVVCLLLLPLLKPVCRFTDKFCNLLYFDKNKFRIKKKKNSKSHCVSQNPKNFRNAHSRYKSKNGIAK